MAVASIRGVVAILGLAVVGLACRTVAPVSPPAPEPTASQAETATETEPDEPAFTAVRACAHLEALQVAEGQQAAEHARAHLRSVLGGLGFAVEERSLPILGASNAAAGEGTSEDADQGRDGAAYLRHLSARLPGERSDSLLLVAPYELTLHSPEEATLGGVANSGAAVLLELARVLSTEPRAYSLWILFVEREASPEASRRGGRALADALAKEGAFETVRAAFFLEGVGDSEVEIVRDLYSTRADREALWQTARELGHSDVFVSTGFAAPLGSHRAFLDAGLRRAVALVDTGRGRPRLRTSSGTDTAGSSEQAGENCAMQSLHSVGRVLHAGLVRVEARLTGIDRFAQAPARIAIESSPGATLAPEGMPVVLPADAADAPPEAASD